MVNDPNLSGLFFDESVSDAKKALTSSDTKEFRDDMKNANYALTESVENDPSLLGGLLLGIVISLAKTNVSEMEVGRSFA